MRNIIKNIQLNMDGTPTDFRLTKLDAFSGVALLRLLASLPESTTQRVILNEGEGSHSRSPLFSVFSALSDSDLRNLMTVCLEHCEVRLPAGWNPVMTRGEWSYIELEHDVATCMKLTIEEVLWTLEGFFGAGASDSKAATPDS